MYMVNVYGIKGLTVHGKHVWHQTCLYKSWITAQSKEVPHCSYIWSRQACCKPFDMTECMHGIDLPWESFTDGVSGTKETSSEDPPRSTAPTVSTPLAEPSVLPSTQSVVGTALIQSSVFTF